MKEQIYLIYRQEYLNANTNVWYKKMMFLDSSEAINLVQELNSKFGKVWKFSVCSINTVNLQEAKEIMCIK